MDGPHLEVGPLLDGPSRTQLVVYGVWWNVIMGQSGVLPAPYDPADSKQVLAVEGAMVRQSNGLFTPDRLRKTYRSEIEVQMAQANIAARRSVEQIAADSDSLTPGRPYSGGVLRSDSSTDERLT